MHTCHTCSIQFSTFDAQKLHMKTDWHRYNCKRKAEDLKGISFDEFSEKLASALSASAPSAPKLPQNDLKKKIQRQEPVVEISEKDCLFCSRSFKSETDNLTHMINDHDFFIPDYEFLVDLKGFLKYLGLKISNYFICLHCNGSGKSFHSVSSTRHHMVSKGHCKIKYDSKDDFEEFEDFYDFDLNSDGSWEEVSVNSHEDVQEEEVVGPIISNDNTELILPTGIRVGHRSLQVYYKQSLKATTSRRQKIVMTREQREAIDYAHKSSKSVMKNHINYRLKMGLKANNQKHHRDTLGYST
jgi:pre-60S factor REI1